MTSIQQHYFLRRRPGLSLVELLISIGIMSIVMLIAVNIYLGSGTFVSAEQQRIEVGENASQTLSTVDEVLREATAVLASVVYSGTTYTSGDNTVVLST